MLTLDEAIKHCEEVAEEQEQLAEKYDAWDEWEISEIEKCKECASEHRQLAEWLRELKFYRTMIPSASEYFKTGKVNADDK